LTSALLVACGTGCVAAHADLTRPEVVDQEAFHVIQLGRAGYVIDSRTETCLLGLANYNSPTATPVSCELLKRNLPEAARFITWSPQTTACR
jgi:hypothetical protein